MYNNSYYSHSKLGVSTKKIHKARGKSCGYYMKIIFFFSSLIQTLIIVSLVLFLIYGQPEESATEKRLQELDPVHNDLKLKYGYLLDENRNLTAKINKTNRQMSFMHGNITMLRRLANQSALYIMELRMTSSRCPMPQPQSCNCPKVSPTQCQPNGQLNFLQHDNHQLKTWLEIVKKNFSDTVHSLKTELKTEREEQISLRLAKITLGQEKAILENEIKLFKKKCQDDIIRSLEGIPEITRAFREKIDTLFPHLIPFHITCEKQHEQLEQIRYNCSSLSVQVENKFQPYLNDLVNKVSEIIRRISHFQAKAFTLERSMDECKKNLSSQEEKYYNNLRDTVIKNERQEEKHLLNIKKLTDTKEVLDRTLRLRESEINMLKEKINTTCGHRPPSSKPGSNPYSGGVGTKLPGGDSTFSVQSGPGINKPSSSVPGLGSGNVGSFATGISNAGGSGLGIGSSRTGPGLTGSTGSMGSTGGTGVGPARTGIGSPTSSGSFGAGTSRSGSAGTPYGSPPSSGSSSAASNTGSFGMGTGRSGSAGTPIGSPPSSGSSGAGSFGTGTGAGPSATGFGSTSSTGASGAGFGSTGSFGAGGSRTPFSGTWSSTSGLGSAGFGGAGPSRTGPSGAGFSGTSGYGAGASRTGMGASGPGRTGSGNTMGMYGASDPISKHLRELQKYLNPEWQ